MAIERTKLSMDGNTAAAHVSYAFTEVAAIYPITPSSPMAEVTDTWSATDRNILGEPARNIFGERVKVMEMQSEAGAAGAVHGSLAAGALTTTYTASQGLLLMIPNMYKIAGELLPCVIHVSARCVASHALNIFGDHSDVYACRQTGFAMLAESNPQEIMDLGAVAHLSTIKGRVPFINFFDGFRTSHEIQKIEVWNYKDLADMVDMDAVAAFRARSINPEHPVLRGSAENGDIFFQHREACNPYYENLPAIVEDYMNQVNEKLGTDYKLFNYYGAPDAEKVIVAMGSVCDVAEEVIDYMMAAGEKVGLVKVRLYRPFVAEKLAEVLPKTVKKIAVLDRTKEPGALGDPLYLDVVAALAETGVKATVVGGRYGLGSKDTTPASIFAVYANLDAKKPKNGFTIGIVDDVTGHSLEEKPAPDTAPAGTISCKFWGLGGDGTVGANKNSIKIIGDHTDKFIQAYFQYDSKKTGGVTISHLRFGDKAIKSPYYITKANFVACHVPAYILKGYKIVQDVKPGGIFLLNCQWNREELEHHLPNSVKKYIAKNNIRFYTVNAIDKAREIGMGKRTNTILQSAFFALANIMPIDKAVEYMKYMAKKSYLKKGEAVVEMNYKAIDAGVDAIVRIDVPAAWADLADEAPEAPATGTRPELVDYVNGIVRPVSEMNGDSLPVSAFEKYADGTLPQGAAAYEKRGVAVDVPVWHPENCIQCNNCAFVCPHAAIRPFAMTEEEAAKAPEVTKFTPKPVIKTNYRFTMAISPLDCMGCTLCVKACPVTAKAVKDNTPEKAAITMTSQESQLDQQAAFDYAVANVSEKKELISGTIFAVADNQARPIHNGVKFEVAYDSITAVAVDGFRLARRTYHPEESTERELSFVVPATGLKELEKILTDSDDPAKFTLGKKHILYQVGDAILVCRLLEGDFLDWRRVVPTNCPIKLIASVYDLAASVERVGLIVSEKYKSPIRCVFGNQELQMRTSTTIGSAEDRCAYAGDGQELEIGFNVRYMADALRAIPSDEVTLELTNGLSPIVLTPVDDKNDFAYMILPVRIKN